MNAVLDHVFYFFLYSVIGWIGETIYCSLGEHKFINRGFLTGPLCPIYGSGATVFGVLLSPLYDKYGMTWYWVIIVIFLGMILADIVEFLTSLIMEKLFNARWWDYSNKKFNIQGRICLGHTMYWGAATFLFVYIVHPAVKGYISTIMNPHQRNQILIMIFIVFAVDLFFAVKAATDVRKLITKINKLYDTVSETANHMKENVSHTYEDIQQFFETKGFEFAVWTADVSRQITEAEESIKFKKKRKNGNEKKGMTNAQRMILTRKAMSENFNSKLEYIKTTLKELVDKEHSGK